jgi:FAD/FMN-containing dehydrogenase
VDIPKYVFKKLAAELDGELLFDSLHRRLYSTDASIYQQEPLAVAYPKTKADIKALIKFAKTNGTSLIPRTAGTSLAGQCVGQALWWMSPGTLPAFSKSTKKKVG